MVLQFIDSFDNAKNTIFLDKWDYYAGSLPSFTGDGRNGTDGMHLGGGTVVRKILPVAKTTVTVGFALKGTFIYPPTGQTYLKLLDAALVDHVYIVFNGDQSITIKNGAGATLATSAALAFPWQAWFYFEFQAKIDNAAGTVEVRINGVNVASAAGVDTQDSANNTVAVVELLNNSKELKFDDFYILDDTGGVNDDFLGDLRVESILPDGAGANTDWTPSAGANWQCVDEVISDEDTTYVETASAADFDTYTYGALSTAAGTVYGVQAVAHARKTDAGARSIKNIVRPAAVNEEGVTHLLSDDYKFYWDLWDEDPDAVAAWTIAVINASEFGVKLQA